MTSNTTDSNLGGMLAMLLARQALWLFSVLAAAGLLLSIARGTLVAWPMRPAAIRWRGG